MNDNPEKNFTKVQLIEIKENNDGQRIDNFLLGLLKGVPKTHIYRILRKGEVRVNKGRIRPNHRLKSGDLVRIPPISGIESKEKVVISANWLDRIRQSILFENQDLIIIDKPSGVAVHGGSGLQFGVIDILRNLRPELPFLELVHRLDRETSGCLIFAKNRPVLLLLHDLMKSGGIEKKYLAGVIGPWKTGKSTIKAPLRKSVLRGGERFVEVHPEGKTAITHFNPIQDYGILTLMEVTLETGRTHQIRVHAATAGHPVAGDEKYGDPEMNRKMKQYGLNRLFLHAHYLGITHPDLNYEVSISAPLSPELQEVLNNIERSNGK